MSRPTESDPSTQTALRGAALLFLACIAGGALAGGVFGLLCGGLHDLLHWQFGKTVAWCLGLASGGATTGAILGLFALRDRLSNAAYWERRPAQREQMRADTVLPTARRVVHLDDRAELTSDTPPAYDSAARDGYFW